MIQTTPFSAGTQTPQIDVATKFMQNYRIASPVNGGGEVVAVCNGSGQVELFTIGTDNTVWNFYPDPTSDTGYSGVSTGLQAAAVSAGVDNQGRIIVFAAFALQLFYIVEINTPTARWSSPQLVPVPQPGGATKIARIITQEIAGNLYVGVLTQFQSTINPIYSLAYAVWQTDQPSFQRVSSMNLSSLNCVWLGNSAQNAAFACADQTIVAYVISTQQTQRYPMAAPFSSIDVDSASDATGNNQMFAILADGNAYHLIGGSQNQPYSWAQISQGMIFRQILVEPDVNGDVQVFAVSGDNILSHWEPLADSPTGYSDPPAPLYQGTALLGGAGNDSGAIDLFVIGITQNSLTHLFQEEGSGNWATQAVEVQPNGQVEEYISYTSDVTAYDAAGALLTNSPVNIWASEETQIDVNGAIYFVDANSPARTSTNAAGLISIAQETGSLAIPALQINLTAVMSPGQSLAIQQYADVQNYLATVNGGDLMDAQDAEGNYLLADQYRNPTDTDNIASALNQCMEIVGTSLPPEMQRIRGRQGTMRGVRFRSSGSAADLRRLKAPADEQHWRLSFADGKVSYQSLSQAEASALQAEMRASLPGPAGFLDWLEDIGDFFEGVVDDIIEIVDAVVTTIVDGVQAVFKFIVDGIEYVFEAIVTAVEQAFDVVEAFLAHVVADIANFFEKLFEWLGFLFDWPDILRTHQALAYTINQFPGFLQGSAAGLQNLVDNGFSSLQGQIDSWFDYAVNNIAGQQTIGGYEQSNEQSSPQFTSAMSNNIILNGVIDNAGGVTTVPRAMSAVNTDPLQQFMQQLMTLAGTVEANPAFAEAVTYFENLGGSPDQIFQQLLAGLLRVAQGVLEVAISGVQALIDEMFQLVQTLITTLQNTLNEAWNIPFVSQFYSWLTNGAELTTIDLIALIVAIPTTILYKGIYDAAPFPTDASVTAFEQLFDTASLLQAAGFSGTTRSARRELAANGGLLPQPWLTFAGVGYFLSSAFFGILSAILDAIPQESPTWLSQVTFILECCAQICSFPWFSSSGSPDCETPDGASKWMWLCGCLGILLDAVFLALDGRIPEYANDYGVFAELIYAIIHTGFAAAACIGQRGLPVAGNILPVTSELLKFLRFSLVVKGSQGYSLLGLAAGDALVLVAGAIIGFVLMTEDTSQPRELALAASD